MEKTQETSQLSKMRKAVEKQLGSSTENYGDIMLMRFLIARSMDPVKATKMFIDWKKWREEFVPLGYIPDSQVPDQLESKKIFLQSFSTNGHPVVIIKTNRHFTPKDQLQFKKFVVHVLDKTIASAFKEGREIENEKLVVVLDLGNIGYKNIDARALITGFQFLQSYYPERLAKLFILSMPWFFVSVWKMVSHFLEQATLDKIVIVSNEDEHESFIKEVGKDALPEEYGGRAKVVAIQDVKLVQSPTVVD
ncbi:Sec14p-like phosphatidylinositol transfer family protein [Thalictrum thalictroides]|uniref:Sec14p-like phosphatidylinositol transfer family protein n=1 Tax=Thalictrum thalictroides TaxID=46969 RepID=A0A7J6XBF1_THATH|nr:Sec14p-like phosphatidylinositol transfer family protein [Thalictrum thalictroides]